MTTFFALSLVLLGAHGVAAVTHSMTYIATAARGVDGFPEYNEVGLVDGQEFVHYDSNLKKIVPKTSWIEKNTDADYWERETQRNINNQEVFKASIDIVMARFNQTSGVHIFQWMYGCEWDDKTDKAVNGFMQVGYDGEDFIAFDQNTLTWIAPKPQAVITKNKWDKLGAQSSRYKNYLTTECIDWLKKYVNYGRSSLMRTDLPSVSLLQKTSSSPVSCLATGFYSQSAVMFWRKDGEELHDERGEILPNHDGSSQMSAILDLSSVKPEDWGKYECVFQLPGVKDVITKLDKAVIKSNEKKSTDMTIIIVAVVVVVALVLLAGIGFMVYKKRNDNKAKFLPTPSDTSSEQSERLKPEA